MNDNHDIEKCEFLCIHEDAVRKVREAMPDEGTLYDLAEFFKIFGDSTRIRILYALYERELCVCDIAGLLNLTQTAVSHQLRILKTSNLVKTRREGKNIIYSLTDDHVRTIIDCGMEHIAE
jgi:ArsR family transcriptional regulator